MTGIPLALAIFGAFALIWVFNRAWIARPFTRWYDAPRWQPFWSRVALVIVVATLAIAVVRLWIMVS